MHPAELLRARIEARFTRGAEAGSRPVRERAAPDQIRGRIGHGARFNFLHPGHRLHMPSRTGHAAHVPLLAVLAAAGCASVLPSREGAPECFVVPYDLLSESRPELPRGTRLTLETRPAPEHAEHGWRVARVTRPGSGEPIIVARWRAPHPDSVWVVQHDGLTGFQLVLRRTAEGLSGTRELFSDQLRGVEPDLHSTLADSSGVDLRRGCRG